MLNLDRKAQAALVTIAALTTAPASAQSLYELASSDVLRLARATAMSLHCGLIDEATKTTALMRLKRTMRRVQAEAGVPDAEAQLDARFDAALAEGDAAPPERCDFYRRRPDAAARQTELIEMLAYGGDPKPQ